MNKTSGAEPKMTFRTNKKDKSELMVKATATLVASLLLMVGPASYAKMPKSIKYVEEVFVDDETVYVHYVVTCSNGNTVDISSWDNNKLWCEGKGTKENCNKKKIKTAKKVCK